MKLLANLLFFSSVMNIILSILALHFYQENNRLLKAITKYRDDLTKIFKKMRKGK